MEGGMRQCPEWKCIVTVCTQQLLLVFDMMYYAYNLDVQILGTYGACINNDCFQWHACVWRCGLKKGCWVNGRFWGGGCPRRIGNGNGGKTWRDKKCFTIPPTPFKNAVHLVGSYCVAISKQWVRIYGQLQSLHFNLVKLLLLFENLIFEAF